MRGQELIRNMKVGDTETGTTPERERRLLTEKKFQVRSTMEEVLQKRLRRRGGRS